MNKLMGKKRFLLRIRKKHGGRDSKGHVSVRHHGGEHKRYLRRIDWRRNKRDMEARVEAIEYDPNRTAAIALLLYPDGERRYILAPEGLKVGDKVISAEVAPIEPGNTLSLAGIPAGIPIHNLEIRPGKGGQLVRSAGTAAYIQSQEKDKVLVKMPSGEIRIFSPRAMATVGQIGNAGWNKVKLRKAGDSRHRGIRPTVRGVAQHPASHPHGGGEGRSGIGMKFPKTPWGKKALGKRTRQRHKYSERLIVKRRKP